MFRCVITSYSIHYTKLYDYHWHYLPATLACLAAGALIGGIQGYFIAFHRIPAFIVTLGGMLVFRGLALWLLHGQSVGPFPRGFQLLSSGFIPDPFGTDGLRVMSLLLGAAVAFGFVYMSLKERANKIQYGAAAVITSYSIHYTKLYES